MNQRDAIAQFQKEKIENIQAMTQDRDTERIGRLFLNHITDYKYCYNYTWMGRPIILYPQDIISLQELIMEIKPVLIIETGIAHGGSLIFSASMLELLDVMEPVNGPSREVLGIDIEIRPHNRAAIEAHSMFRRITMLEGSSTDSKLMSQVKDIAHRHNVIMVLLDSCHTEEHVLKEMMLYGPLVSMGSYLVVYDTIVELGDDECRNRPWGKGNNPYTAVRKYMAEHDDFVVDNLIDQKNVLTSCPGGWLKRVKASKV